MLGKMVKLNLKQWRKLVNKLRYLKRECKKKDKIIIAYEKQVKAIKANFNQATKDI